MTRHRILFPVQLSTLIFVLLPTPTAKAEDVTQDVEAPVEADSESPTATPDQAQTETEPQSSPSTDENEEEVGAGTNEEAKSTTDADGSDPASEPEPTPTEELTEAEARAAFRLGDRLYLEGDYEGAIKSFERAYALSGRIEMLFNLANAHERLGNYDRASVALRGYIPHSPEENRPALEKRLARFEQLAIARHKQDQETAEAVKDLKENPRPFPLARGLGIGFLTLGTAGIATGIGFAVSAAKEREALDDSCVEGSSGRLCTADVESNLSQDKTYSNVADVSLIAGAVLAGTGVFLLIHSRRKEREEVELRVGIGPNRVQLGGTF